MSIRKLLIANRGEIACRVARTARAMGILTVAVYSEADVSAMHVKACDEARCIGPAPARESYLVMERILEVARETGADAVHPGYGFLSENAGFAKACDAAGVIFVGPPVGAIEAMGSKAAAKALMDKAGVPLVPGYHGEDQDLETFRTEAARIGYPVLLKASAGGGGKGMRIVSAEGELEEAWNSARREALNGFGDDRLLVEKYLTKPRHVEVQVFADSHGNAVHLFERDCSLQRRHQKVVEEAPAPGLSDEQRAAFGAAAVAAAEAIDYRGAGTVEFIMDEDGSFFFMEMNTRLQVEHPVTELITGQDLVEWQIRVARGEALPLAQDQISRDGHAFEVRLYAENPARDFLPQIGRLQHLQFPEADGCTVRVDTGVGMGDEVSPHYDPMIAKLITWGDDRTTALGRMAMALDQVQIVGLETNADFLQRIIGHSGFASGDVDTGFIERHLDDLVPAEFAPDETTLCLAALAVMEKRRREALERETATADPWSPWGSSDGWRLNDDNHHDLTFRSPAGDEHVVRLHYRVSGFDAEVVNQHLSISGHMGPDGLISGEVGRQSVKGRAVFHDGDVTLFSNGQTTRFHIVDPMADLDDSGDSGGKLTSPMPGKIIRVDVAAGDSVSAGQTLLVMEAMKMEHAIAAPADGTVEAVNFEVGDSVDEGVDLVQFAVAE